MQNFNLKFIGLKRELLFYVANTDLRITFAFNYILEVNVLEMASFSAVFF